MHIVKATNIQEKMNLATEAHANGLYVVGWTMQQIYKALRSGSVDYDIAVAYDDEKNPIGAIVQDDFSGCVDLFVKKDYRRKGVGRALVNIMMENDPEIYGHYRGAKDSELFFEAVGIL
jgi:GNAT superfamily N-acetyltransferase